MSCELTRITIHMGISIAVMRITNGLRGIALIHMRITVQGTATLSHARESRLKLWESLSRKWESNEMLSGMELLEISNELMGIK